MTTVVSSGQDQNSHRVSLNCDQFYPRRSNSAFNDDVSDKKCDFFTDKKSNFIPMDKKLNC